jgi:hypothetical protein
MASTRQRLIDACAGRAVTVKIRIPSIGAAYICMPQGRARVSAIDAQRASEKILMSK